MLQAVAAPAHHALHPHPKIQAQKLMEKTAVGMAASANTPPLRSGAAGEGMGEL